MFNLEIKAECDSSERKSRYAHISFYQRWLESVPAAKTCLSKHMKKVDDSWQPDILSGIAVPETNFKCSCSVLLL